jgi:hypothetical protein
MIAVNPGTTDVSLPVVLVNSTTGLAATGLTITDLDLQYTRIGSTPAAKVDATALAATNTAHTDNYAIELDATDQPGAYRVDWPDAAFATGASCVLLTVKHTSCHPAHIAVWLDTVPSNVLEVNDAAATGSGTPDVNLASCTAGSITSAAFAAGAITATVIADNAIDAASIAADARTIFWTTALTEAYAADGAAFTGAQALYMIFSALGEFSISGTTITCKKLDGSTTSMTYTIDDASSPTSRTKAS